MPSANYSQTTYVLRADSGGETGCLAAQLAPQDSSPASLLPNTNYRIRFGVAGLGTTANVTTSLQVSRNAGTWLDANLPMASVKTVASPFVADGAATTQQITTGYFAAGEIEASAANALNLRLNFPAPYVSEFEFCFQINPAMVSPGDNLQLRMSGIATFLQTPYFLAGVTPAVFSRSRNLRAGSRSPC